MDHLPTLLNLQDDTRIVINNTSFSVGRSLDCDYVLSSLGVSRFHCIIKKNSGKWMLFDRSTNGTVVNNKIYHFNEQVDLKDGDVIKVGGPDGPAETFEFVFREPSREVVCEEVPLTVPLNISSSVILLETEDNIDPVAEEIASLTKKEPPPEQPPLAPAANHSLDLMENELTCSICSELFVKAVTLTCSHTYCKYCIDEWRKSKKTCPICRNEIREISPTLVLDNFIERFLENQSEEVKATRKELVASREALVNNTPSSSNSDQQQTNQNWVIEISDQEDDDDDDDSDDYDDSHYDSWGYHDGDTDESEDGDEGDVPDIYYNGVPGRYYGGYGRCYFCNQVGHWANGCPWK